MLLGVASLPAEGRFLTLSRRCPDWHLAVVSDPKETSALQTTTAAMQPGMDIARIVSFVTDVDRPAREPLAWDDDLEPMPDQDLLASLNPTSSTFSALPHSRRLLPQMAPPPLISSLPPAPKNLVPKFAEARY